MIQFSGDPVSIANLTKRISEDSPGTISLEPEFLPPSAKHPPSVEKLLSADSKQPRVYVSHAHSDTELKDRHSSNISELGKWLIGLGCKVFTEVYSRNEIEEIGAGVWFDQSIEKCDCVLIVCSPALERQWARLDDPSIPLEFGRASRLARLEANFIRRELARPGRWHLVLVKLSESERNVPDLPPLLERSDKAVHRIWTEAGVESFLNQLYQVEVYPHPQS